MKPNDLRKLLDAAYSTERQPAATTEYLCRSHEILPLLIHLWEAYMEYQYAVKAGSDDEVVEADTRLLAATDALDQYGEGEK